MEPQREQEDFASALVSLKSEWVLVNINFGIYAFWKLQEMSEQRK